jgi:hypothetical protein
MKRRGILLKSLLQLLGLCILGKLALVLLVVVLSSKLGILFINNKRCQTKRNPKFAKDTKKKQARRKIQSTILMPYYIL